MAEPCINEARVLSLELGQREVVKAINDTKEAILDDFGELRTQLFGNGKLTQDGHQAGLFPLIDRRLCAVERRTEFDERVKEEVDRRMSALESTDEARDIRKLERKVEKYRDELQEETPKLSGREKLQKHYEETPMWARVVVGIATALFAMVAPGKLEAFLAILKAMVQ